MFVHAFQKTQSVSNVAVEVLKRVLHGFSHQRIGGKVHHRFDIRVRLKGSVDLRLVCQVAQNKRCVGVNRRAMSLKQVVENNNVVAGFY